MLSPFKGRLNTDEGFLLGFSIWFLHSFGDKAQVLLFNQGCGRRELKSWRWTGCSEYDSISGMVLPPEFANTVLTCPLTTPAVSVVLDLCRLSKLWHRHVQFLAAQWTW